LDKHQTLPSANTGAPNPTREDGGNID